MKSRIWILFVTLLLISICVAANKPATLDDFLDNPARMKDIKAFCLVIASQTDPDVAAKNTAELRRSFWAARPEAGLSPQQAEFELKRFDSDWQRIVDVVQERHMTTINFCGVDTVLLKKAQQWYFGGVTPRGPVLIRISIQFNPDSPMTLHGVEIWTQWDDIKTISRSIELQPGDKVWGVTYEKKKPEPTTQSSEQDKS